MSALALPGGDQQAYAETWGTCQAATNDFPRPRSLQTSGFGHILHFFCKICYFVWRSTAVHQKYNSVTNPASCGMTPLWTLKTI